MKYKHITEDTIVDVIDSIASGQGYPLDGKTLVIYKNEISNYHCVMTEQEFFKQYRKV